MLELSFPETWLIYQDTHFNQSNLGMLFLNTILQAVTTNQ